MDKIRETLAEVARLEREPVTHYSRARMETLFPRLAAALAVAVECPHCAGTGRHADPEPRDCWTCNGTGSDCHRLARIAAALDGGQQFPEGWTRERVQAIIAAECCPPAEDI